MTTTTDRGKWAEGEVRKKLKKYNEHVAAFAFHRHPDARAGSLQTAPADFEAKTPLAHFLLEVKQIQHEFRLPQKNFAPDKVARMAKWQNADSYCWVIVCHMPMKTWRLVPLDRFRGERPPSWDLRPYPVQTLDQIMEKLFGALP